MRGSANVWIAFRTMRKGWKGWKVVGSTLCSYDLDCLGLFGCSCFGLSVRRQRKQKNTNEAREEQRYGQVQVLH